ncbi:MAG: hypothetical protein WKG07_31895 [Hymenobacter sp.]
MAIQRVQVAPGKSHGIQRGSIQQESGYPDQYTVYFVTQLSKAADSLSSWQMPPYTGTATTYWHRLRNPAAIRNNIKEFEGKDDCGVLALILYQSGRAGGDEIGYILCERGGRRGSIWKPKPSPTASISTR